MKYSSLSSRVSRLVSFVGAASCRAILPPVLAAATGLVALPAQAEMVKAIDMEHHFFLPEFVEFMKTRQDYPNWKDGLGVFYRPGALFMIDHPAADFKLTYIKDVKAVDLMVDFDNTRLKYMDYAGITSAALSNSAGIEMLSREDAVKFARMSNDAVAAASKRHPGRYVGTITLPTPYVDESIRELERAVKVLGLKYWHTHANYGNRSLCEPQFEPLLAKCSELNVPFYLHPVNPSCDYLCDSGLALSSAGFGFGVDAMKTAIRLITGGLFDRYPNLRMILGHMGEYFPYCIDRMNNRFGVFNGVDPELKWKHDFTFYFKNKNIFMTTSGIYDPNVVDIAIKNIGIDNIMLGTDYPLEDVKGAVDFVKNLPISAEDKEKILYRNAEKYILSQAAPGCFVHFTPETLDAKTQAVIDGIPARSRLPKSPKGIDALLKKLASFSYEQFAAKYPEFSKEYNVESMTDKNGWKTLKLTCRGERNKNLPEANVFYVHGGAQLINFTENHRNFCERLAREFNFTVYIPLYPLAPNYCVDTTFDMLMDLYKRVRAEGKPVFFMGESAGGNISLGFSLYLKDKNEVLPDAIVAISPHCDFSESHPMFSEYNKRDILLSMEFMREVQKHWRTKDMTLRDPYISPRFGNWKGMCPVFLFAATDETMYPEIMETAESMRNAGVRVGMLVGRGLFHAAPLHDIPVGDQLIGEITAFLYGKR